LQFDFQIKLHSLLIPCLEFLSCAEIVFLSCFKNIFIKPVKFLIKRKSEAVKDVLKKPSLFEARSSILYDLPLKHQQSQAELKEELQTPF